jgi:hypothetical protein
MLKMRQRRRNSLGNTHTFPSSLWPWYLSRHLLQHGRIDTPERDPALSAVCYPALRAVFIFAAIFFAEKLLLEVDRVEQQRIRGDRLRRAAIEERTS